MNYKHSLALLALASCSLCAYAEQFTCVSFEYPPLIHRGMDGRPEGLAVDIVGAVFKQMGHSMTVELYPWGRSLASIQAGEKDCIFTLYRSAEREQFLDYSTESIVPQIVYFYAKKGSSASFNGDLGALNGLRIGTAYKVNYGPKFEEMRARLNIDEAPTIEQNFKKLAIGRVDLVPSNLYTATSTMEQPGMKELADNIVKLPVPIENVPSYIGFAKSRKLAALRNSFDIEFRKFVASGEYKRLLDKYKLADTPEFSKFLRQK